MRQILVTWILTLSCLMTVPLYGQNLLTNPGFEDGNTTGWVAMGEYGLNVTDKQAHRGKYSIYCHDRTANWQGPNQNILGKMKPGQTYMISAWVRLENLPNHEAWMHIRQKDDSGTSYPLIDSKTVYNDKWVKMSGNYELKVTGQLQELYVYWQVQAGNENFYVDDAVVAPEVVVKSNQLADGRTAIALRAEGMDQKTPEIPATIQVFDTTGKELASGESRIGSGEAFSLPLGFANVAVEIPNYCGDQLQLKRMIIVGDAKEAIGQMVSRARQIQARPNMTDYAGWIDYLATQVDLGMAAEGDEPSGKTIEAASRLAQWTSKLASDANTLSKLRGLQEWAYLSKADGTGQPFLIGIPEDYDRKRSYPLYIELHGRTLTHMHFASFEHPESDRIKLFPLGRSRGGGYGGLSEVDVLEAFDYVVKHWNIDPDHVHLAGISMGGFGTFSIASRFPDLFASAIPKCGGGAHLPMENALHVPFYALHSKDDDVVPVFGSRVATRTIEKFGGSAIQDETDGLGHAVWLYNEGLARAQKWADGLVRKKNIDRVHYTAMDELARKAYWVELLEWGPEGQPTEIDARIGTNNTLYLALNNVGVLKIDLKSCPAEKNKPLTVVINRHIEKTIDALLPDALYIVAQKDGWLVTKDESKPPGQRLHFPGGAMALYHGEPIMIVWGTGGDKETNKKIYEVAQINRQLCRPSWPSPKELVDGVPMDYTIYGRLPGKPDSKVTEADMQKYNLLLIGTAKQNSVVAKLYKDLPVKIETGRVSTNDGLSWDCNDCAAGLLYYNPLAPKRLIYWVSSESADFYTAESPLMGFQHWETAAPDFLVMHATEDRLIAARRFDTRWEWEKGYKASPLIKKELCSEIKISQEVARIMRQKTGADFTLYGTLWQSDKPAFMSGQTRWMDITSMQYYDRIVMMELSGQEILDDMISFANARNTAIAERKAKQEAAKEKGQKLEDEPIRTLCFFPGPNPEELMPQKLYSVVAFVWEMEGYVKATHKNPESLRNLAVTMRDILK
jgi:hypothetical protein